MATSVQLTENATRAPADDAMPDFDSFPTSSHRFAFGGVAFEVRADEDVAWQLSPDFARHAVPRPAADHASVAGTVHCRVRVDPALPAEKILGITITRVDEISTVVTDALRAEVVRIAPRRYEANARIAANACFSGADAVALGVAAAIVQAEGGVNLHAAAVELEGRGVLFIGPSGAGKSTAVRWTGADARVLSYDRVSVASCGGGRYVAWSLPGGEPVEGAWSELRGLPLAAILRVRQGRGQPRLESLSAARRLFALRESTEVPDSSAAAEELRMQALEQLSAQVPIAEIHTVLGVQHSSLLGALIESCGRSRIRAGEAVHAAL